MASEHNIVASSSEVDTSFMVKVNSSLRVHLDSVTAASEGFEVVFVLGPDPSGLFAIYFSLLRD